MAKSSSMASPATPVCPSVCPSGVPLRCAPPFAGGRLAPLHTDRSSPLRRNAQRISAPAARSRTAQRRFTARAAQSARAAAECKSLHNTAHCYQERAGGSKHTSQQSRMSAVICCCFALCEPRVASHALLAASEQRHPRTALALTMPARTEVCMGPTSSAGAGASVGAARCACCACTWQRDALRWHARRHTGLRTMLCAACCVRGERCDADTMECPAADAMCSDPGYLTCVADLNDCSGRGDCFRGSCYCHHGWGGADCSVPLCLDSCADVRPPPAPRTVDPAPSDLLSDCTSLPHRTESRPTCACRVPRAGLLCVVVQGTQYRAVAIRLLPQFPRAAKVLFGYGL